MPSQSAVLSSFLIHCLTGFLGFRTLLLFMYEFWFWLVPGLVDKPLKFGSPGAAPTGCLSSCSVTSLVDVGVGVDLIGWGRNIPGKTTMFLRGSIKPLFSSCNFRMVSNLSLLMFSASEWRSFSFSLVLVSSESCICSSKIILEKEY